MLLQKPQQPLVNDESDCDRNNNEITFPMAVQIKFQDKSKTWSDDFSTGNECPITS